MVTEQLLSFTYDFSSLHMFLQITFRIIEAIPV